MKIFISNSLIAVIFFLVINVSGCYNASIQPKEGKQFYLAHNIWYEPKRARYNRDTNYMPTKAQIKAKDMSGFFRGKVRISSLNYKDGILLPTGTHIDHVEIGNGILNFRIVDLNLYVTYIIVKKHEPLLTSNELFDRMITTKTFDELTEGVSDQNKKAIKSGKVLKGMSKSDVLFAFGYPPSHRTNDLTSNTWIYWLRYFKNFQVNFDKNGMVIEDVIL